MKNKRIISIVTIVALLLFVIVSKISIFEKSKAPFSDSQLYDLLKQYQEKADTSNIEDEAEISQLDIPVDFNFSVDFYHINGNDYMMISGMRGYSFILRDRIELKSNEFMGFASYDDYHIAFFINIFYFIIIYF